MRKILLILCTLFFAMVFISCNNEDKNIPSKPTETDWEEIEESCTETISGVEEFDFSVGEWEYYQYGELDCKLADGDAGYFFTDKRTEKILIEESNAEKRIYIKDSQFETKYVFFSTAYYEEMKSSFEENFRDDNEVKLESDDEAKTLIVRSSYPTTYTEEYSYADFIDDFSRKTGTNKYMTNEDKSVLMLESSSEYEINNGEHHKWIRKEFYVKNE